MLCCSGAYCAVICSDGYRSQDIWRIKCKPNNQWSHEAFSPCLTCTDIDLSDSNIVSRVTYRRQNLPSIQIRCSDSLYMLVENRACKSSKVTKFRCTSRRNKVKGSSHHRNFAWRFRRQIMISVPPIHCIHLDIPKITPVSTPYPRETSKFQFMRANCSS